MDSHQWYRRLLAKAGVPDEKHDSLSARCLELEFASRNELAQAVSTRKWQDRVFELADLEIPREFKDKFNRILLCPPLPFGQETIKVCCELARLAYKSQVTNERDRFEQERMPLVFFSAQTHTTKQKYLCCVLTIGSRPCLVVAFAGTHQDGDWTTNLTIGPSTSQDFGGSVHGGFLTRCEHVKFSFLHRLATKYQCKTIIFSGHSLGGAISHLSCLFALRKPEFQDFEIYSCAFAAPFVFCQQVCKAVADHDWSTHFVNFVNPKDPVPRLLNLSATLTQLMDDSASLGQDVGNAVKSLKEILGSLCKGLSSMMINFVLPDDLLGGPSRKLKDLLSHPGSPLQQCLERLDVYKPSGIFVFLDSESQDGCACLESADDVTCKLGPAKLLNAKLTLEGAVASDNIRQHDIDSYALSLRSASVKKFLGSRVPEEPLELSRPRSSASFLECLSPSNDHRDPETYDVKIENVLVAKEAGSEGSVNFKASVVGLNLDLIGLDGIDMLRQDRSKLPGIRAMHFCMSDLMKFEVFVPPGDQSDISVTHMRFSPDVGYPILYTLGASNIVLEEPAAMSAQQPTEVVFNEHFLSRALKMAWLRQHHANDPKLRDELFEFDDLHKISSISAQLRNSYTTLGQSSEALCSLGETEEVKRQIKQKIEWLCPKSGLCLETKTTRNIKFVAYAGSVAVAGVSLWFTGGASILLAFLPQTNGFGTAICSLAASGAFGKLLDRYYSSVQADYDRLLAELLGGLGTRADRALAALLGETGMEKKLLEIAEAAKRNGTPVCDEGDFADLTPASADLVKERLDAIRLIRSMKELVFLELPTTRNFW